MLYLYDDFYSPNQCGFNKGKRRVRRGNEAQDKPFDGFGDQLQAFEFEEG